MTACRREELLIHTIALMLDDVRHVAVGARSPIPGAAALLARERAGGALRVSLLGSESHNPFTDGGCELFDCAAQGRIDAFFLGGAQIDGRGNINLVGIGPYPRSRTRFSGSFGSAYLYFLVRKVILFTLEHSRRVMVPRVDFVSAPGTSAGNVFRRGGPHALVTPLCVFEFLPAESRFRLRSVHAHSSVGEVRARTGFDFDCPDAVATTAAPDAATLALLRGRVARALGETYPRFAAATWGVEAAQPAARPAHRRPALQRLRRASSSRTMKP